MAGDTALLVIDMQVGNVAHAYQKDAIVARLAGLIAEARAAGTPVVFVQHEDDWPTMRPGGPDWQFLPGLTPAEGELVIHKRASDAFYGTPLREELAARGIRRLVVTGVQTELCVDATCRRAASEGFDVTLVADGHTTEDSATLPAAQIIAHHNLALRQMAQPDHPIAVRPRAEITF
ncbi:MAG TPA: cysteine hydrolase family protein [Thermomicrobiales bacterium]|nr:cysteine hydrolase family protein [Thermomicrobiales bacterium]